MLFAHGVRNPEWSLPFRTLRQDLANRINPAQVKLAFLEASTALVAEGPQNCHRPLFVPAGGHIRKDLSHPIAGFSEGNPEVRIDLLSVPGEMLEVRQALANGVASRLSEL